jgi:hypothetical protein
LLVPKKRSSILGLDFFSFNDYFKRNDYLDKTKKITYALLENCVFLCRVRDHNLHKTKKLHTPLLETFVSYVG